MSFEQVYESFFNGTSESSYSGRIASRNKMGGISQKIAYNHAYRPTNAKGLSQLLRLKQADSQVNVTTAPSYSASSTGNNSDWTSKVMDEESSKLLQNIQKQASAQFIQNFYNAYMSPANSDICYRLGTVTRTKHSAGLYDSNGNPVQTSSTIYNSSGALGNSLMNTCEALGQTDRFGRIDTVSNLRVKVDIDPSTLKIKSGIPLTPGYSEYYVNWYFPPFNSSAFDISRINDAKLAATREAANKSYRAAAATAKTEFAKATEVAIDLANLTKGGNLAEDKSLIPTYDPIDMMCSRDGFTYRTAGYKAVNDNINFLQHIFEECTGVVSTYLTEWDLSLYIQEGLLTEYSSGNIWLCNRMEQDNPQGLSYPDAYNWGVINAAVSKLLTSGAPSNMSVWNPQAYYLSSYWWPYNLPDRGDGLSEFWDYASVPRDHSRNSKLRKTFLGKIKYEDYVHAAYAGWKTFDDMQYYQALYTDPSDGLSVVDIVHAQESAGTGDEPYDSLVHEINAIQDALYADDDKLGFKNEKLVEYLPGGQVNWPAQGSAGVYSTARILNNGGAYNRLVRHYRYSNPYDSKSRELDYTDYYYNDKYVGTTDALGKSSNSSTNSVDISGEGNIRILGAEIPGSSMLKVFLKRNKYKQSALGIAAKTEKGFGSFGSAANGTNGSSSSSSPTAMGDLFAPSPDENGRYSNPLGIPRLGPALFGGPHGAFASPQTMQAYFDADNPFLRSIARINPAIAKKTNYFKSNTKEDYYQGVESSYMFPAGRDNLKAYIGRSPSETLHLLTTGICETVANSKIRVLNTITTNIYSNDVNVSYRYYYNYNRYSSYNSSYTINVSSWSFPSTQEGGKVTYEGSEQSTGTIGTKKTNIYVGRRASVISGTGVRRAWVGTNGYVYIEYYKKCKRGTYQAYREETYNRPLLHCIPYYTENHKTDSSYSHWQIARYSRSIDPDVKYLNGSFKDFLNAWGGNDEVKLCGEYQELKRHVMNMQSSNETLYRLTMPYFRDNYKNNTQSKEVVWYDDMSRVNTHGNEPSTPRSHGTWIDRYKPEEEFVTYMLRNAGNPGNGEWTNLIFCISNPEDTASQRKNKGPRAIVQIPCRIQVGTVTYNEFHKYITDYRHKPACDPCHQDWTAFTTPEITTTYKFIECDVDNADNFWASTNWNEGIYRPNLANRDIMTDVPDERYHIPVKNSIWEQVSKGPAPKKFRFPGRGMTEKTGGDDGGQYLTGWGIYSALPGFGTIPKQYKYEDANEVLNLGKDGISKSTPIKNYAFSVPMWRGGNAYKRTIDGEYQYNDLSRTYNCSYKRESMATYDPGFQKFLVGMYTSCTLFTPSAGDLKGSLTPFTTDISNCLISAMKLVQHQKAYLKFGKELFENSVESSEVIRIINKCVDKRIVSASIGAKRDVNSIFYNEWIYKAWNLYNRPDANQRASNAFQSRIDQIDTFLTCANNFMKDTKADSIGEVSAENWSYNDYLSIYDVFASFKEICDGLDSAVEEYFYSYLNVLYEYRKFYINKRCNKQDGTLWTCRAFESVIPMLAGEPFEESTDLGANVENTSMDTYTYSIAMKILTNSPYDKGKAIVDKYQLDTDRIKQLLMPCVPATEADWVKFINGKSDKEIIRVYKPDPNHGNNRYYAYIEKPKNGTYQLISREFLENKQNKDYNSIMENMRDSKLINEETYKSKLKDVDDRIQDCIFRIIWMDTTNSNELEAYLKSIDDVKEYAKKQEIAKKNYTLAQQEQVEHVEAKTKQKQNQEQVIENWKNTVSYAKQCMTLYYDYADPWFYGSSAGDARFKKLTQMVALSGVIAAKGKADYNKLKDDYSKTYNVTGTTLNDQLNRGLNALKFDSTDDAGLYDYYAGAYTKLVDSGNSMTVEVIGTPIETFNANVDELHSWISQYRDAVKNLSTYEAKLALEEKNYKSITEIIEKELKAAAEKVEKLKKEYDKSVSDFNAAVAKQAADEKLYKNSIHNKSAEDKATAYTWVPRSNKSNPSDLYPDIVFNLVSGIDLSKFDPSSVSDPEVAVCSSGNFVDYWVITLPIQPRDIGYNTGIKIRTYNTDIRDADSFSANMATTVAGPFAYSLYPITEDQQGAIAAIAADLTDAEKLIRDTYA